MVSIIAFKMVLQLNSVILIKELKRGVEPNSGKIYFSTTAVLWYVLQKKLRISNF